MNQPELGKKILELRQNKGLTQSELAECCNLSLRTIQRIEASEVTPRNYTIKSIFSCLDYDFNDLMDNPTSEKSVKDYPVIRWLERLIKYVPELFNLKTNTMKKVSVLSLGVILITAGFFLFNHDTIAQNKTQTIDGWFLAGSHPGNYNIDLDKSVYKTGKSSAVLESTKKKTDGFGTLMQTCSAEEYLGKRIKMTAYVKSKDVSDWAGMWMRVDSKYSREALSFDNMQDRPIKGTSDWTKCEIILDVPEESSTLNFGILLSGAGKVWFDDIKFEVVSKLESKETSANTLNKKPINLNFK